jgi:hypothetical protein
MDSNNPKPGYRIKRTNMPVANMRPQSKLVYQYPEAPHRWYNKWATATVSNAKHSVYDSDFAANQIADAIDTHKAIKSYRGYEIPNASKHLVSYDSRSNMNQSQSHSLSEISVISKKARRRKNNPKQRSGKKQESMPQPSLKSQQGSTRSLKSQQGATSSSKPRQAW